MSCDKCHSILSEPNNGPLEAADCYIHSVRCDVSFECALAAILKWTSSGNLRCCSNAVTSKKSMSNESYDLCIMELNSYLVFTI